MKIGRGSWQKRFWLQVDKTPGFGPRGVCWRWTGHCAPYGRIQIDGVRTLAHRAAYEMHHGPLPEGVGYHGTCVRHRCDNPACVNPEHLVSGTHRQNVADRDERGRQSRGLQHSLPRRGERHAQVKLTNSAVRAIRRDGRLYREIADDYAIAESTVCNLKRGYRWPHLTRHMEPT